MEGILRLRIVLVKPTTGVDFGLQKGSGNSYDTILKQRSETKDLNFEFDIQIKNNADSTPAFTGPIVQGAKDNRFIYIDIGTAAGQYDSCWSRRLKIPLTGITRNTLHELSNDRSLILEARVKATAKDGGPNCGTVKPFEGWKVVNY